MSGLRITIDPGSCMGSGTCIAVAPNLFDMGDEGTAVPLQPVVEDSAKLGEAVSRCPTGAIELTEESPA